MVWLAGHFGRPGPSSSSSSPSPLLCSPLPRLLSGFSPLQQPSFSPSPLAWLLLGGPLPRPSVGESPEVRAPALPLLAPATEGGIASKLEASATGYSRAVRGGSSRIVRDSHAWKIGPTRRPMTSAPILTRTPSCSYASAAERPGVAWAGVTSWLRQLAAPLSHA